MENDRVRQVVAAVVGVLVIVVLVLFARWTGDRIRERFLAPKPAVVTIKPQPVVVTPTTAPSSTESQSEPQVASATTPVTTIPQTGPADFGYFLLGFLALSGVFSRTLAKRLSPES